MSGTDNGLTYDSAGRVASTISWGTDVVASTLTNTWDDLNRRTSVAAYTGGSVTNGVHTGGTDDFVNSYEYDDLSRMTRIEQSDQPSGTTVADKRIDLTYDALSRFDTIVRYSDLTGTNEVATSVFTFDDNSNLTALDHKRSGVTLTDYTWAYDVLDRVTNMTSNDGDADYDYAYDGQLLEADYDYQTDESYAYDANGNRTGYTTGTNNQLTDDGTYTYLYDDEGNRTKKTNASDESVEYHWDHRNRLTIVTFKNSSGVNTKQVHYVYDAFDRLIGRKIDDNGNGTFDRREKYVYDGDDVVLVYDASGSLTDRFLHGPAVDQVFAQEDASNAILWALTDNLGTVRDVVNNTGVTQNHIQYDAFGNVTAESNSSVEFRYAYTGRFFDEDTALQYNRARWYDATVGRWISEDPIGFEGGDANLSRYVGNGATNAVDPDGLYPEIPNYAVPHRRLIAMMHDGLAQKPNVSGSGNYVYVAMISGKNVVQVLYRPKHYYVGAKYGTSRGGSYRIPGTGTRVEMWIPIFSRQFKFNDLSQATTWIKRLRKQSAIDTFAKLHAASKANKRAAAELAWAEFFASMFPAVSALDAAEKEDYLEAAISGTADVLTIASAGVGVFGKAAKGTKIACRLHTATIAVDAGVGGWRTRQAVLDFRDGLATFRCRLRHNQSYQTKCL